jgi:hypothetical protein
MNQPSKRAVIESLGVDLQKLLALESLTPEVDAAVFLAGSLVEGMGNKYSDIDVFVVGGARPKGESLHHAGDALFSVHMLDTRRVDFEYWTDEAASGLAAKLNGLSLKDGGSDNVMMERRLTEDEIMFIHRIRTGIPLIHEHRLEKLRARFDFDRLSQYLLEVKMREIDDALEDLYGMMEQPAVGLMRARELLNCACDAYVHHKGGTSIRRKWRTRQLELLGDEPEVRRFSQRFWQLQFPEAHRLLEDASAYRGYVETCIRFCNQTTDAILG